MRLSINTAAVALVVVVTAVTVVQSAVRSVQLSALANPPKPPPVPCVGEPITVADEYGGGPVKPWSCKPQCADGIRRYLLYTNGYATQCAVPPECTDEGEDKGITCEVVAESREG
jgi:hypothetical protein